MKLLARSLIWRPGLDQEVEMVKACTACQEIKNTPIFAPIHQWIWPDILHRLEFMWIFRGKTYFVTVDALLK